MKKSRTTKIAIGIAIAAAAIGPSIAFAHEGEVHDMENHELNLTVTAAAKARLECRRTANKTLTQSVHNAATTRKNSLETARNVRNAANKLASGNLKTALTAAGD